MRNFPISLPNCLSYKVMAPNFENWWVIFGFDLGERRKGGGKTLLIDVVVACCSSSESSSAAMSVYLTA